MNKEIIDNILNTNGKTNIFIFSKETNIETNYQYKIVSKNIYFFQCSKRPKCKGKAKFNKKDNKFYIIEPCTNKDIHNKLSLKKFSNLIDNSQTHLIDFKIKKINLI